MPLLETHSRADRLRPLADLPLLIFFGRFQQKRIEFFPTGHVRHRHHMVPAKVPAFSFHAAFFVALRRRTELRFEIPMRSEGDESRGLLSLVSSQNLFHRRSQVVIPKHLEHTTKISERPLVSFQKGLLARMREGAMESPATVHAPHAKHVGLLPFSADVRIRFIPVHLCFFTPAVGLRNEHLLTDESQFHLSLAHVATNRGLADLHPRHLCSKPAPDPMCGVPLLPWRLPVRFQNPFHKGLRRLQFRSLSHSCFSLRWNSAEHGLTHHAPMNPQLLGDSSDRSPTMLVLASYLLE